MTTISAAFGLVLLVLASPPAPDAPFTGRLSVQLVADSIWEHCEFRAAVDVTGTGTQEVFCTSRIKPLPRAERPLGKTEVAQLRVLLRDADLFQGQFWGSDLRGIDGPFVTLTVHDQDRAAVLVCFKNESFESGARGRLFAWLSGRIQAARGITGPK